MSRCRNDHRAWSLVLVLVWPVAAAAADDGVPARWSQAADAVWSTGWQWRLDRWQTALRPGNTLTGAPHHLDDSGAMRIGGAYRFGETQLREVRGGADRVSGAWRAGAGVGLLAYRMETRSVPYVSLGYDARWPRWGLGLAADVGLQFRRDTGTSAAATVLQDGEPLRPMPNLQVNLSYSF